jgi:predicted helicase
MNKKQNLKQSIKSIALDSYNITYYLNNQDIKANSQLHQIYVNFQEKLCPEFKIQDFGSTLSQILTYTIFLAKLESKENINFFNFKNYIPEGFLLTSPLLDFINLIEQSQYSDIKDHVLNIMLLVNNLSFEELQNSINLQYENSDVDVSMYFYENFLKECDLKSKKAGGVYYTPPEIVKFIINQVSSILQEDFDLVEGLANNQVKLLDFACGTGTFILKSYKKVLELAENNAMDIKTVAQDLIKNFHGFELSPVPFTIADLKIKQLLKKKAGYLLQEGELSPIVLKNTLENKKDIQTNLFAKAVAEKGREANKIKDNKEIIAIIGNPPYNSSSQNEFHKDNELLKFHANYKCKDETNSKSVQDDYIKFIAFAHKKINDASRGVIGVIVNNSFLKGLTHRKMRNELMKDFDKIYIIDLHGNARIGETAEDGSADQNVFDIMQGVCIILLVKNKDIKRKGIFHIDLYGKRKAKFNRLNELDRKQLTKLGVQEFNKAFRSTKWGKERFIDDLSFFSPMKEATAMLEYGKFWGLTDVFGEYTSGIQTIRDNVTIHHSKESLKSVLNDFQNLTQEQIEIKYKTEDARDWKISRSKQDIEKNINNEFCYQKIHYRPFDVRETFYSGTQNGFVCNPRFAIMQHMLNGDNVGLVFRRSAIHNYYDDVFVTSYMSDLNTFGSHGSVLAPLYLHTSNLGIEERKPNCKTNAMIEYGEYWGLTDVFGEYVSGIETQNDGKYIHFQDDFVKTIEGYEQEKVKNVAYRPFDTRKIYYDTNLLGRARFAVMQHMLKENNMGLIFERGHSILQWHHAFIVNGISDGHTIGAKSYLAPLYLHTFNLGIEEKKPNFKPEFAKMIAENFGNPTPEEVLAFIYASMHSPTYRTKYLELLKIDFPRINFDVGVDEWGRLSKIGQDLIDAHLMRKIPALKIGSCISTIGFDKIICQKPKYNEEEKRIYIGKEVYFDCVTPEIWNFKIGGYQVLDKYLKERAERILTQDELKHVSNIIKVLGFTIGKMKEIDAKKQPYKSIYLII